MAGVPLLASAVTIYNVGNFKAPETKIALMTLFACGIQMYRAIDPSGMGGVVTIYASVFLMQILSWFACSALLTCMGAFLFAISEAAKKNKKVTKMQSIRSNFLFVTKVMVDVGVFIATASNRDKFATYMIVSTVVSCVVILAVAFTTWSASVYLKSQLTKASTGKGSVSDTPSAKQQASTRLRDLSRSLVALIVANVVLAVFTVYVLVNFRINFTEPIQKDNFATYGMFFVLIDVLYPLVQFLTMFAVMRVFVTTATTISKTEFKMATVGIVLLIVIVVELFFTQSGGGATPTQVR